MSMANKDLESFLIGMDFGRIEAHVAAMLVTLGKSGPEYRPVSMRELYGNGVITIDSMTGTEMHGIRGKKVDFVMIDDAFDWPTPEQRELDGPPMKQNGRSAAYLVHDRTKRQGRKRR